MDKVIKLETAIMKAKKIMEGYPEMKFTSVEYMEFYDCVYFISMHRKMNTMQLYKRFKGALEDSITSVVLPSLDNKQDAPLLIELTKMWSNYKIMSKWLKGFFMFLDRCFIPFIHLPPLTDVVDSCFRDLVFHEEMCSKFQNAVISLINQERNGKQIDRDLLKSVLELFVAMDFYLRFEKAMLTDTAAYYSQKFLEWNLEDSVDDLYQLVVRSLGQESERCGHYLHHTKKEVIDKVVRETFRDAIEIKSLEKYQIDDYDW